MPLRYLYLPILVALFSCSSKSIETAAKMSDKQAVLPQFSLGINFLSLEFKKKQDSLSVSVLSFIESPGELKDKNPYPKNEESYYKVVLCDANEQPILECFINNPLAQHMDVYSPDGSIMKKEVLFDQQSVNLRFQKTSLEISKCKIYKILPTTNYQLIQTLNLKP